MPCFILLLDIDFLLKLSVTLSAKLSNQVSYKINLKSDALCCVLWWFSNTQGKFIFGSDLKHPPKEIPEQFSSNDSSHRNWSNANITSILSNVMIQEKITLLLWFITQGCPTKRVLKCLFSIWASKIQDIY